MSSPQRPQWQASADKLQGAAKLAEKYAGLAAVQLDRCPPLVEVEDGPLPVDWRQARWHAAIPQRFHMADLSFVDEGWPLRDHLVEWANGPGEQAPEDRRPTPNLLMYGPTGTGKTYAAIAAARQHFLRGAEVAFWPAAELLDGLRPGGPDGLWDRLVVDTDVLVIDDLGAHKSTEWADERLDALVNRRWLDERPVVATTNLTPDQLAKACGTRLLSRLADIASGAVVLGMGGEDRRMAAVRPERNARLPR